MAVNTEDSTIRSQAIGAARHAHFTVPRKPISTVSLTTVDDQKIAPKPLEPSSTPLNTFLRVWHRSSLRVRAIAIGVTVIVIALVIGLAAGLSPRQSSLTNLPLPSRFGGPYTGDLTYYAPGLGACGITSSDGDKIVAVSYLLYDAVQTGSDPNSNPLCGKRIRVKRKGGEVSVDLTVVDRCTGCEAKDLDVTENTFAELADVSLGRVPCEWSWLDAHGRENL